MFSERKWANRGGDPHFYARQAAFALDRYTLFRPHADCELRTMQALWSENQLRQSVKLCHLNH